MSDVLPSHGVSEHTCRRVLTGAPEEARPRLVRALERLDYRLLSEQSPILARRAARKSLVAADMLDVARTLTVGLKPSGAGATLATFDITVVHGLPWELGDGDRHTLELEADAIVALTNLPELGAACASCGVENLAEARFCRGCGAPHVLGEPAELELVRLEAGARAAHQEHVFGLLIMLVTLLAAVPMILMLSRPGLVRAGWTLFTIGLLLGGWMLLYGVRRLHRTLNPKDEERRVLTPQTPPAIPPARASALPPRPANFSVTEGTTELLGGSEPRQPAHVPATPRGADTDPIS